MLTPVGFFLQRFMNLELRCGQLLNYRRCVSNPWWVRSGTRLRRLRPPGLIKVLIITFKRGGEEGGGGSCVRARRLGLSFVIQKSNKLFQANFWLFIISKDFAKRCMIKELMLAICSSLVWKKKLWMDDQRSAPMTMWPTHPPKHTSRFSSKT